MKHKVITTEQGKVITTKQGKVVIGEYSDIKDNSWYFMSRVRFFNLQEEKFWEIKS